MLSKNITRPPNRATVNIYSIKNHLKVSALNYVTKMDEEEREVLREYWGISHYGMSEITRKMVKMHPEYWELTEDEVRWYICGRNEYSGGRRYPYISESEWVSDWRKACEYNGHLDIQNNATIYTDTDAVAIYPHQSKLT